VANIDQYGNLVSLRLGTAVISVTVWGINQDSKYVKFTDAHELIVSEEWGDYDNNIHPDVWGRLRIFNSSIESYAEQISFLDFDSGVMEKNPFAGEFKNAYGVAPAQVKDISSGVIDFNHSSSYPGTHGTPLKPSISVTMNDASSASGGGVLPVRVTYSLSWDEVEDLLGRDGVTKTDTKELFGKLSLAFTDSYGRNESVLADNGREGADASALVPSGGAKTLVNSNNGLTLTFDVFLSDADAASDGKSPLVANKYLTAADGAADGAIAGSLWLLESKSGGDDSDGDDSDGGDSDGGGGEGGGGCDAGLGFFALFVGVGAGAFLLARGNRRD
jgi:hypothetical protein